MGRAHEVRKEAMARTAAIKSKLYSRFGKEIYMAAKNGIPEPDSNLALKKAIEKAKAAQVPADVIKRNIEKAKGSGGEDYTPIRYEGFGWGGATIIVECMTDNVNRTFGDVRSIFTKTGAKIGVAGSVIHNYQYVALVMADGITEDEALEAVMDAGIEIRDIRTEDEAVTVIGEPTDLDAIKEALLKAKPDCDVFEEKVTYLPNELIELDDEDLGKFYRFRDMTDELDDVQDVYTNIKLPPEEE
ncbi:MAG: YebC/PmpR family DNA-binding transcriptional regulator [Candidatus Izemoplasmatales bacterium]